jgi:hypothetical protein
MNDDLWLFLVFFTFSNCVKFCVCFFGVGKFHQFCVLAYAIDWNLMRWTTALCNNIVGTLLSG